jgi:hypothetical protein
VNTTTALQAFSLAFGPLPGVALPTGQAGIIPDATGPLQWLVGHWADITPDQRAAAIQLVPELASLDHGAGSTATAAADRNEQGPTTGDAVLVKATPTPRRSDFFYTQIANQAAGKEGAKVGRSLGIPVKVHVNMAASGYDAVTDPLNASGGYSGTAAKCAITMTAAGDAMNGDNLDALVFHEVWHCFQGTELGLSRFWNNRPAPWIIEGQANWVGNSLAPGATLDGTYWGDYLVDPDIPLFQQAYSAMGFYAQLESSGTDTWQRLDAMLQASGNAAAFQAAGANGDAFLNAWASGFLRKPERGTAWDIVGANVTDDAGPVSVIEVPDGASVPASAKAYTTALFGIPAAAADVFVFSFPGHARVSDGSGHDYLINGQGTFCHKDGGCECPGVPPDQGPPLLPLEGMSMLAVTGDPGGDSGTVTGKSLDEYCPKLTGTWNGTWRAGPGPSGSGTFVVTFNQKGKLLSGSVTIANGVCITGGAVQGSVQGSNIQFGVVNSEHKIDYTGTWTKNSMAGTFSTTSCGAPPVPLNGTWKATRK